MIHGILPSLHKPVLKLYKNPICASFVEEDLGLAYFCLRIAKKALKSSNMRLVRGGYYCDSRGVNFFRGQGWMKAGIDRHSWNFL